MPELSEIDWESLGYAQIPDLVKGLGSDDPDIQRQSFYTLDEKVLQGGLHWQDFDRGVGISKVLHNDAQLLLIPFLLDLLRPDLVSNKIDVILLLVTMLHYTEMDDEGQVYTERAIDVRTAIWEGRQFLLDLLSHENIKIRMNALSVIISFKETSRILQMYELIARRFAPILPEDEG